jgi:hypothetical protein
MPFFAQDPDAVLKWRRQHRRQVQRDRAKRRKDRDAKEKPPTAKELADMAAAIERDGDK